MARASLQLLRRVLPWATSAGALFYVFGVAIDWEAMIASTRHANLPLFIAITVVDKLIFFLVWGLLQAEVLRHFVGPVPRLKVLAIKGGTELLRVINNSLADAGFFLGVSRLVKGGVAAVVAVAGIPFACHFGVLLLQATLALPLLEGGFEANRDVTIAVGIGWTVALAAWIAVRRGHLRRLLHSAGLGSWIDRVESRKLLPFVGWFALFALFDVIIQGLASRAFGIPIPWLSLMARIPILYVAISVPSLGNFGTRELAWSGLFADSAASESLVAFSFATNTVFLVMHVLIGAAFVGRAIELTRGVRQAQREGDDVPAPFLRDSIDP